MMNVSKSNLSSPVDAKAASLINLLGSLRLQCITNKCAPAI